MKDLTTGKEHIVIIKFAAPMLLGNLFQLTYNIIDSMIVGKLIGEKALAAVGASFPIIFALISFTIGIASAGTIIISQYYGSKNFEKVKKAIDTILLFVFVASILIMFVGIVFARQIFEIIKLPDEVFPQAIEYLRVFMSGTILLFGFHGISSILRGIGDSKTPLYFQIFATVLNISLDYIFVKYFGWGVKGVALATVISHGVIFIAAAVYLNRTHKLVRINILRITFDKHIFRQCLRIGVPSGLQQTFVSLGMMALNRIVNNFGTEVLAAYTAAGRIDSIAMLPSMIFGQALSTFVGQNLGAGKVDRVRRGLKATLFMSIFLGIIITIGVFVLRYWLIGFFTHSQSVINIGAGYLLIVSSAYVIFAIMFSLNGVMRGAGDTLIPMFITLISLWIIRIPIAALLSGRLNETLLSKGFSVDLPDLLTGKLGETGIWWSVPIAWAVGAICSSIYYRTGRWKKKVIVKQSSE